MRTSSTGWRLALRSALALWRVAFLAALFATAGVVGVRADCLPVGGTSVICSGTTSLPQLLLVDDAMVTTTAGFVADTTVAGGPAVVISGNGTLSYIDTNASTLVSPDLGILVSNLGGGAGVITVSSNGAITSEGNGGAAVMVENFGVGATSVALSGPITSAAIGVLAGNSNLASTGDVTLSTGAVTAGLVGIVAGNAGLGALNITTTDTVVGDNTGIWVLAGPDNLGGVSVDSQSVTGGQAIDVTNFGLGATTVKVAGTATGTDNNSITVAVVDAANTGGLAVEVRNATARNTGILAVNSGLGPTSITSSGTVASSDGAGIAVLSDNFANTNDLVVDVNSVLGKGIGILVGNDGVGTTRITVGGLVQGETAIVADSFSNAAVAITNIGNLRSSFGASGQAIDTVLSGPTTIANNARLTGGVDLSDLDDTLVNAGVWDVGGSSSFGLGNDSVVNQAGATLLAARLATVAETTRLLDLESFSGGGTLSLLDGGTGDRLEIDGNALFGPGAVQAIDIGVGTDGLAFAGTADISQATLRVELQHVDLVGKSFAVLAAAGGVAGPYRFIDGGTAYLRLRDFYDANNAYLEVLLKQSLSAPGRTPNQISTGRALESLAQNNPLVISLLHQMTDDAARAMLDGLSGEIHASGQSALLHDSRHVRDAVLGHLRASLDTASLAPVLNYVQDDEAVGWSPAQTQIWSEAYGGWGTVGSDRNASEMRTRTGGLLTGADTMLGDWRVGLMLGYGMTNISVPALASAGNAKSYQAGLYGGSAWGDVAFRTGMAYGWSDLSSTRTVMSGGAAQTLTADYGTSVAQAFGELTYTFDLGNVMLEPFANAAVVGAHRDGFTEQGGTAALSSSATSNVAAFTTLGLRASTKFIVGDTTLATATVAAGWQQGAGNAPLVQNSFAGSSGFAIAGSAVNGGAVVIDAGLELELSERFRLGGNYNSVIGSSQFDQNFKGSLAVRF